MNGFAECPICGGELVKKRVEKLLRGGVNTAAVEVDAEICLHCGERLYSEQDVRMFEEIRAKLSRKDIIGFKPMGQSFQVPPPAHRGVS